MLAAETLADIQVQAMDAFSARDFARANVLIDALLSLGFLSPEMLLLNAVALEEISEGARAAHAVDAARALAPVLLEDRSRFDELQEAVEPWLPGGKLDRARRDGLKSAAQRWLPGRLAIESEGENR